MHHRTHSKTRTMAATALVVAALVGFGSPAEARRTHGYKGDAEMTSTGVDADARGKLKASSKHGDGRFEVSVGKLDARASYEVLVDGVKVASVTTSRGGSGKARLRSNPKGRDGLLGFDPRSAGVVIRDAAGRDVLFGTVPADDDPNNDADIVCCLPDDDGTECEDRTPAECTAKGGTISTATSCVPNPCEGSTPPAGGDIVCCIPDDSGTECEDRTTAECTAQGGTVVAGTSCSPNPCAAIPPADPDIQCCLPDDGAYECEDRTPAECSAQGGTNVGDGVCAPDACAALPPPTSADVRCCLPDDSGPECEDRTAAQCAALGGVDLGAGACAPDTCAGVTFPSGSVDDHGGQSGKGGKGGEGGN